MKASKADLQSMCGPDLAAHIRKITALEIPDTDDDFTAEGARRILQMYNRLLVEAADCIEALNEQRKKAQGDPADQETPETP